MIDLNIKILVVDDSKSMRMIIVNMLNKIGFKNIDEAKNGKKGLEKLEDDEKFDLVLSDWSMPYMSGLDLLKAIRKDEKIKDTIFVMITAESLDQNHDVAVKEGADGYIAKPFTPEKLKAELEKVTSKKF